MLTIQSNRDLEQFGIVMLTGESCAYSKRILCDLTWTGYQIFCKCFGLQPQHSIEKQNKVPFSEFTEAWNPNSIQLVAITYSTDGSTVKKEEAHILSVMLPYNAYELLGFWCLEGLTGIHSVIEFNRHTCLSNLDYALRQERISKRTHERLNLHVRHIPEGSIGLGTYDEVEEEKADEYVSDFYDCLKLHNKVYSVKKSGVYGSDRNQHQMSGRVA